METSELLQQIADKESGKYKLADKVISKPEFLPDVFAGLNNNKARIRYGCLKILRIISEKDPGIIYPMFDDFVNLLKNEYTVIRWGAILILANLAAVDSKNRFEKIFDIYFAPIKGPVMITAANIIGGAAVIASAKNLLAERISAELLRVEKAEYKTAECRNIALGHVIKSYESIFDLIKDREPVIRLIKEQLNNTRGSTRKKAEKFIKKFKI